MIAPVERKLFSVEEYERMAEAGILSADDRLELIEGEIIKMAPIGVDHATCVDILNEIFVRNIPPDASVRVQNPLRLEQSEPQPDLMILRRRPDFYRRTHSHPPAADVALLVEVSDSTIGYDRDVKLPLYARAIIAEVWIIDLPEAQIAIYTQPSNGAYQEQRIVKRGESFTSPALPGLILTAEMLLG
jgi:Uma2 family endonuclease